MREVITKVYKFSELSDQAKQRAIDDHRSVMSHDSLDLEHTIEWLDTAAKLFGLEIERDKRDVPKIEYSISYSQGDGLAYAGQYAWRADAASAIRKEFGGAYGDKIAGLAERLETLQAANGNALSADIRLSLSYGYNMNISLDETEWPLPYIGEDAEAELKDLLREFARIAYQFLVEEFEWQNSDEVIAETIEANEYEFDENGKFF